MLSKEEFQGDVDGSELLRRPIKCNKDRVSSCQIIRLSSHQFEAREPRQENRRTSSLKRTGCQIEFLSEMSHRASRTAHLIIYG